MDGEPLFVDLSKLKNAIDVLRVEQACVQRNDCDRNCAKCDLVLPDTMILDAYSYAIDVLQHVRHAVSAVDSIPWSVHLPENS